MTKKIKAKAKAKPLPLPRRRGVMAIIPYSEIQKPEVYKGKYTLIPTPFNDLQIKAIIAPTPTQIIKQRPGKGGGNWDYVPGWWFKKKLNFVFGFSHDFEIIGERVDGDFITVKGKLTVKNPKTGQLIAAKTDYGGAAIKYLKDRPHKPENYLDISNDFKAAATDSLKRCAVQFGFAMDIYGKSESVQEGYQVSNGGNPPPEIRQATVVSPAPAKKLSIDYKQKLTDYLEDRGQLKDASKIKFIQDRALIKVYDYKEIKPAMAQVILAQLARGEATKK
jgi:hypothetical protein